MLDARIEFNTRFALPLACILLSLAGVPLGITTRRAGKSAAVVLTVALALIYYIGHEPDQSCEARRTLAQLAVWLPNFMFAVFGRRDAHSPGEPGRPRSSSATFSASLRSRPPSPAAVQRLFDRQNALLAGAVPSVPQIVDPYILASFLFYFLLLLLTFVRCIHVFEFFHC